MAAAAAGAGAAADSGAAEASAGRSLLTALTDLCLLRRSVVLLPAPLRTLLPAQGSVLLRPEPPGADQPGGPSAASAALPQRRNPGAAASPAALHHPGPVSPSSSAPSASSAADWSTSVTWSLSPGRRWTGGCSWPTPTTRALCPAPSISCSCWTTAALTWCW